MGRGLLGLEIVRASGIGSGGRSRRGIRASPSRRKVPHPREPQGRQATLKTMMFMLRPSFG